MDRDKLRELFAAAAIQMVKEQRKQ